jgi:integrase/recombinase XerC
MDKHHLQPLIGSFELTLLARNLSGRTVRSYLETLGQLDAYLAAKGVTVTDATSSHLKGFLADLLTRGRAASTAVTRHKHLRVFYRWLLDEDEIGRNPMQGVRAPIVPDKPVPVVPEDGLRRLLAACDGKTFLARRDTAIIMLLLDTGLRAGELINLKVDDVDFTRRVVQVVAKGRKPRDLPFGHKTGLALDRYLRVRARHVKADLPWLWLAFRSWTRSKRPDAGGCSSEA